MVQRQTYVIGLPITGMADLRCEECGATTTYGDAGLLDHYGCEENHYQSHDWREG